MRQDRDLRTLIEILRHRNRVINLQLVKVESQNQKLLEMVWDGKFGDKLIQCALRLIENCVTKRSVAFRSFSCFYWITNITHDEFLITKVTQLRR